MRAILREAIQRLRRISGRVVSWRDVRRASSAVVAFQVDGGAAPAVRVEDAVSMIMTVRVTNEDRASILDVVLERVRRDLVGADLPFHVGDSSSDAYRAATKANVQKVSSNVDYRQEDLPMTRSYVGLLRDCVTPFCYLQFDDQITTNLSPAFLLAASGLLERYGDLVPLVSAVWPLAVKIDGRSREINVLSYRQDRSRIRNDARYRFGDQRARRPIRIDEVDGFRFGIFENFYYGFYFNHMVTRPEDYARRLEWYLEHVRSDSAHDIEIAASGRALGPYWKHIAVCLEDVTILDVDYSHTSASVRPETRSADAVFRALKDGFDIRTFHDERRSSSA